MDYKKMHDELDHRIDGWGCEEDAQTALLEIIINELTIDQVEIIKKQLENKRKQWDFEQSQASIYSKYVSACYIFQQHTD